MAITIQYIKLEGALHLNEPFYYIVLLDQACEFTLDFNTYQCVGKNIVYLSPYQHFSVSGIDHARFLQFHGDYYCIEYHKKEVACNGILFNNIYDSPYISSTDETFRYILDLFDKVQFYSSSELSYDIAISKTYLQLILALSSKEKQLKSTATVLWQSDLLNFKPVLEQYFLENKSVSFYAEKHGVSVSVFSKMIKKQFGKTPIKLIQERMVLEAKKQLHLTRKSVKEIATALGFEDEFYFSRYFKKEVGVSPKIFRELVGISIVAK